MLQVKNLVKRYTTKGETVAALDGVSVNFPERGMVFLLGKSGSGKSTLLNISGGLDTPDEGEVIVKGKSSKDFTGSDFDSYRNTYVGFIFQEYNILTGLTVAENVGLALELQGKPRDEESINELLKQVGLEGYGSRAPNTLSGGQKQRVAIARALVKNPEIIMADEPTGALDSDTGKQVFDTLKKLSEEKLVVIVSHDRDFAESYADRIIELKDGKIISDVTRGGAEAERGNLTELSEKKLTVTCGAAISEEEERRILSFLRGNKGSVVISAEKEDVGALQSDYVGFSHTVQTETGDVKDESHFIKSKFPFRYALKMGISGLKLKPLRLVFTTLLATIAFIVFGVFSTLITYDTAKIGATTLNEASYGAAVIQKYGVLHMKNGDKEYTSQLSTGLKSSHFSDAEIETLREKYPKMNFIPAFTFNLSSLGYSASLGSGGSLEYYGRTSSFTAFAYASDIKDYLDDEEGGVIDLIAGEYPTQATDCLISLVTYEAIAYYGYMPEGGEVSEIGSYEDLIGKQLRILGNNSSWIRMRICGIVDTHEDYSAFEALKLDQFAAQKRYGLSATEYSAMRYELQDAFAYSMASLCFVGDGFYETYAEHDLYVNGDEGQRSISQGFGSYFVSSKYLTLGTVEMNGHTFTRYSVNPESEAEGSYIQYLFASLRENRAYKSRTIMKLDAKEYPDTDISYWAPYSFMTDIRTGQETFSEIFVILGTAACVLAVFAALLLFNFISASINAKKKEIGILRAVGARGIDVFKIFIVEAAAITLFCFLLGSLGSLLACAVTNKVMVAKAIIAFKVFAFSWLNILIVLAIAGVTALVATAIPVMLTVKRKPVEAIRSL